MSESAAVATSTPEHGRPAAVRRPEALEDLDGRRLAGAVRPEQPEHLAAGHLEVDPVDGLDLAVALDQALDPDDRRARHRAPDVCITRDGAMDAPGASGAASSWSSPPDQSMSSAIELSARFAPASGAGAPRSR